MFYRCFLYVLFAVVWFAVGFAGVLLVFPTSLPETVEVVREQKPDAAGIISPIAAGIVPHHLAAETIITDFFTKVGEASPQTIVLVSPDHWGKAREDFTTVSGSSYRELAVDEELLSALDTALAASKIERDDKLIEHEHGVNNLLSVLQANAPESKILPIALSASASESELDAFVAALDSSSGDDTVVVASTDFSHYLPSSAADFHDATSLAAIRAFEKSAFRDLELDCWQCVYAASAFAEARDAQAIAMIGQSNSAKFAAAESTADETTSYMSLVYEKGEQVPRDPTFTLAAVGDIMLGRYVETLMNERGDDYPFEKMDQFFRGVDVVFGNLEGPIDATHTQTPNNSLVFSFETSVADLLRAHGFTVVATANNHSLDQGAQGYEDTVQALARAGLGHAGHPRESANEHVYTTTIHGQKLAMLGFLAFPSDTLPSNSLELVERVAAEPDTFVVVSIHWGTEYSLTAGEKQRALARALIDAGADVILGHHPHVVQNIEVYNNRFIFYSLGNFVFDQYFSSETQEGLAVGLEVSPASVTARLFPVTIDRSQPRFMKQSDVGAWLAKLANRSDAALRESITSGILSLDY